MVRQEGEKAARQDDLIPKRIIQILSLWLASPVGKPCCGNRFSYRRAGDSGKEGSVTGGEELGIVGKKAG